METVYVWNPSVLEIVSHGRGAASQSLRASAGEIHPPPGQYYYPNDKHGWLGIVLRLQKSVAPFALSSLALALIVAIGSKFHLNTAVVVLLCLLVIVMHELADGLISSAIISLIAGTCLVYSLFLRYSVFGSKTRSRLWCFWFS